MKLKLYSMAIVFVLLLVGCNTGQDDMNNNDNIEPTRYNDNNFNNRNNQGQGTGMRPDRTGGTTNINNRNTENRDGRYDVSSEAADRITDEIDEIDHAYVLTTNNNAYVAAVLDNDGQRNDQMNDRRNMSDIDRGLSEARDLTNENRNRDRDRDRDDELSDEVKDQIADIVQSVDSNIDNVYVTTNPDFADLTDNYMNDLNEGAPVRGFFDQIGNMIERVFPQNQR